MKNRSQPPFDPDTSRFYLRRAGYTQRQLARDLNIADATVSMYLDGRAYSQRFWDHFKKTISGAQQQFQQAS